ncbi:TetR/AcrR family transcriptional regulator [Nocardia sp. GCM10030253]|uniref:TetR/AcrR family transcriptional regulator n=1 Tax=Nocardia sp. GCM10030253 TaxID=3273404 RepID=UPI0036366410
MSVPMTPWGPVAADPPAEDRKNQILDTAWRLVVAQGVSATSMSQLAAEAGISRVLLYRHYENRDAVVRDLLARELFRFYAELHRLPQPGDAVEGAARNILHTIAYLRNSVLLRKLLVAEPALLPYLTLEAGPLLEASSRWFASQMIEWSVPPGRAVRAAEMLTRFVASVALTPRVSVDFDDVAESREVVTALVRGLIGPGASM